MPKEKKTESPQNAKRRDARRRRVAQKKRRKAEPPLVLVLTRQEQLYVPLCRELGWRVLNLHLYGGAMPSGMSHQPICPSPNWLRWSASVPRRTCGEASAKPTACRRGNTGRREGEPIRLPHRLSSEYSQSSSALVARSRQPTGRPVDPPSCSALRRASESGPRGAGGTLRFPVARPDVHRDVALAGPHSRRDWATGNADAFPQQELLNLSTSSSLATPRSCPSQPPPAPNL